MSPSLSNQWLPWTIGITAFLLMLIITPIIIRLANHMDWVSHPKADRWHQKPTALMGGIAIYIVASFSLIFLFGKDVPWIIWAGASLMFFTGLVDDLITIKPTQKFILQIIATSFLLFAGFRFAPSWPLGISVTLTFIWTVGITNAVNLLDNMDGLAAGICAIGALVIALFSYILQDWLTASLLMAVCGASAGFLIFNFNPAKIFMGDSGSLFLGYSIASFAIVSQAKVAAPGGILTVLLVPVALMAVPIFDTTFVTLARGLSGRAISQGGRDHSSHRLVLLGFSERKAVLTLYAISLSFGLLGLFLHFVEVRLFHTVIITMFLGLVVFGIILSRVDVYKDEKDIDSMEKNKFIILLGSAIMYKKQYITAIADFLLITVSFILTYDVLYGDGITSLKLDFIEKVFPIMIGSKLFVFYGSGFYNGMWGYAGTNELVRYFLTSMIGSILSFLLIYIIFYPQHLSSSFLLLDVIITTISIVFLRLFFRGLNRYYSKISLIRK